MFGRQSVVFATVYAFGYLITPTCIPSLQKRIHSLSREETQKSLLTALSSKSRISGQYRVLHQVKILFPIIQRPINKENPASNTPEALWQKRYSTGAIKCPIWRLEEGQTHHIHWSRQL